MIGDVLVSSILCENLRYTYPDAQIDYLIRKGNEQLFDNHPFINQLLVWDKKDGKLQNQLDLIRKIRKAKYNYTINCQRHFSTGLFTIFSGAKQSAVVVLITQAATSNTITADVAFERRARDKRCLDLFNCCSLFLLLQNAC